MSDVFSGILLLNAKNNVGAYQLFFTHLLEAILMLCRCSGELLEAIESFPMGVFCNTFQIPKCNSIRIEFIRYSQARVF